MYFKYVMKSLIFKIIHFSLTLIPFHRFYAMQENINKQTHLYIRYSTTTRQKPSSIFVVMYF